MVITNKANLPQAFVNFVSNVRHNKKGYLSATTLLKGEKEIILSDRHFDEIEQDASDMVWASFGTALHAIMEKQEDDAFKEEYFECQVGAFKVTGRVDRYDMESETLEDWKTASTWKVIYQEFDDWKRQGLIYAWLMKQQNLPVRKCRFIALLKDHSKTKAKTDPLYPQKSVFVYEFDVNQSDLDEIEVFIKNKVQGIQNAYERNDDDIEPCSAEERWESATKWAVMKDGRKTAVRLFDTETEAKEFIERPELKGNHFVEKRCGESKKCGEYCACKEFCNFYKNCVLGDSATE